MRGKIVPLSGEVPLRARRALLYTPGDDMQKIVKATTLGVDSICMDMEDGVAAIRKAEARSTIVEALQSLDFKGSERLIRINAIGSGLEEFDLQQVLPRRPDGIVIPKVESRSQLLWVNQNISDAERLHDWPGGSIVLIAIIESPRGIVNLPEIASAVPRLAALIFGAEDLASNIGATRTQEGWEVFFARSAVVLHACAYDLQAIDMVCIDFNDLERLRKEALQGAQMGFAGKQIIHPNQVSPVQDAYSPSDEAILEAKRIIHAFEQHQIAGQGAFALDGKMIDAPIVKSAARVIERARAAGKH